VEAAPAQSGNPAAGSKPADGTGPLALSGTPLYSRFVRLTNSQWENSVHDILKLTTPTGQSEQLLHAVAGTTDFDNNERVVVVNNDNWSDFQTAAEAVAASSTATDQALQLVVATKDPATFIKTFGRRAFRRDLTAAEVTSYTALYTQGSTSTGTASAFTKGAGYVITAMLQSPNFMYRTELGDNGKPLSGSELAAKLSLWLLNTTPSDSMLDAAAKGAFDSADGALAQAKTMMDAPAAVSSIREMHSQLYKLPLLDTITKDKVAGYSDGLKAEFTPPQRVLRLHLQPKPGRQRDPDHERRLRGPLMAAVYGVKVSGTGTQQVALSDRAGWYTQAPYLTPVGEQQRPGFDSPRRTDQLGYALLELGRRPPCCLRCRSRTRTKPTVPATKSLTNGCGKPCHTSLHQPGRLCLRELRRHRALRSTT
jgi:hypothetical protein